MLEGMVSGMSPKREPIEGLRSCATKPVRPTGSKQGGPWRGLGFSLGHGEERGRWGRGGRDLSDSFKRFLWLICGEEED